MEQILFYHIWELQTFWSSDLNNLMNNPSNSPVIFEKQMCVAVQMSGLGEKVTGQLDIWYLIQDFSQINALGIKFDLAIK